MDPVTDNPDGPEAGPALGPPLEPPADVWANALAGALHDPRSPEELADLLPPDDPAEPADPDDGIGVEGLDDAQAFDGSDELDAGGDVEVDPGDPAGADPFGADGPASAPDEWQPAPADPEDGPGWLE